MEKNLLSRRYESVFCIFLLALAFLSRDNPYLAYPQIFYLLLLLLGLNLLAGRALRVARWGKQLSAGVILANCATVAAIVSYSGEQASNLWVLFLLPIYTGCMLLDGREVAWIAGGAVAGDAVYYLSGDSSWDAAVVFGLGLKSAVLVFAALTTWKVVLRERRSQVLLERSNAELERTGNYLHLFRRLIGQIDDALLVINPSTGRVVDVNGTFSRKLGYSREELKNPRISDWPGFLPEGAEWKEWVADVRGRKSLSFERELERKDASRCPLEFRVQWASQDGKDYIIAVARDVAERRRAEMQLRQAQKMDAVGRMAAGVAHDFNDALAVITAATDVLLDKARGDGRYLPDLEIMGRAGERCTRLTRQLLAFSRQQWFEPKLMDLNAAVAEAASMVGRLVGKGIRLETALFADLGAVRADAGHIQQVLVNLCVNARDAMPEGGVLTLATLNAEVKEELFDLHDTVPAGSYVMLRVQDTGAGMSAETMEHLFEPFFTTKGPGKGTGLGLSVIHGIVKQSGGYVQVSSEPGRGTAFTIYFPRAGAEAWNSGPKTGSMREECFASAA